MEHRIARCTGGLGGSASEHCVRTLQQGTAVAGCDVGQGERTLGELAVQVARPEPGRYGGRLSSAPVVSASARASLAEEWKPRAFPPGPQWGQPTLRRTARAAATGRESDPSPPPRFRTHDPAGAVGGADLLGPMNRLVQRLLATPCEQLVSRGRVRMRRLACAGCQRQTWVVVGPPRCAECARGAPRR